jgi:tRNA threonylcarbamoyladenosine biosynthesis protein TsaB
VTTAKTLANAVGAQVLGVNTLEVIAQQAPAECSPLEVALDAQRRQVFAASFARQDDTEFAVQIVDIDIWLGELNEGTWVSGPVLSRLADRLPAHARLVDSRYWQPTAAAVGRLAWRHFLAGRRDEVWQLVPLYLRQSAAEEKQQAATRPEA